MTMCVPARSRAALALAWVGVNYFCAGLRRRWETQQSILRKETCVRRTQNEPGYSTASDTPPVQNSRVVESVSAEGGTHTLASIFCRGPKERSQDPVPRASALPGVLLAATYVIKTRTEAQSFSHNWTGTSSKPLHSLHLLSSSERSLHDHFAE